MTLRRDFSRVDRLHRLAEDRIIKEKLEQQKFNSSRLSYLVSDDERKIREEVSFTLPLEVYGFMEIIKVKDNLTGFIHRVNKRGIEDFFDNHPRPHDLSVLKR